MAERFRVNIKEIIRLLGERLYTTPDVVFRELVQNAHDSVCQAYADKALLKGRIDVITDTSPSSLEFRDNGTGMDRSELVKYLSTLGETVKRAQQQDRKAGPQLIGEFGFGFFSAFMIADQIIVLTRKQGSETIYRWTSEGSEEYDIDEAHNAARPPGTTVRLILQRGTAMYADPERVYDILRKYCNYLMCGIYLNGSNIPANVVHFPWEHDNREARRSAIALHFGGSPSYFKVGSGRVGRTPFDYAVALSPQGGGTHSIYSRRMFVTDRLRFLPDYLTIVDFTVNCDALKVSMGRENIIENQTFARVTEASEEVIMQWLGTLLRSLPNDPTLRRAIKDHQETFRHIALSNSTALDRLACLLLFPLADSDETITVDECVERSHLPERAIICVTGPQNRNDSTTDDRENLMLLVAKERGIPVLGLKDAESEELVRRICNRMGIRMMLLKECARIVLEEIAEGSELDEVRRNFERFLGKPTRVAAFSPSALPLVMDGDSIVLNEKCPYLTFLSRMRVGFERLRPIYISLMNIFQALDRSKVGGACADKICKEVMAALEQWGREATKAQDVDRQLQFLAERWWLGPAPLAAICNNARPLLKDGQKYQMRCFIACPFDPAYRDVVNVIVEVCRSFGIYAETAEEMDNRVILNKVCLKIDECDVAIVDISENNPNVMLELGLLIARRKPAMIISDRNVKRLAGSYVPADVCGIERIEYDNKSEDLRRKLTDACRRIEGILNAPEPNTEAK